MDKGKAPATTSSPPKDVGGRSPSSSPPILRERSRSPPPPLRGGASTSSSLPRPQQPPPQPAPIAAAGVRCPYCPSVFPNENSMRGHLHVHSRPPVDSTAAEAWEAILQAHNGNPPARLAELFRPQLERERSHRGGAAQEMIVAPPPGEVDARVPSGPVQPDESGTAADVAGPSTVRRVPDLNKSLSDQEED